MPVTYTKLIRSIPGKRIDLQPPVLRGEEGYVFPGTYVIVRGPGRPPVGQVWISCNGSFWEVDAMDLERCTDVVEY